MERRLIQTLLLTFAFACPSMALLIDDFTEGPILVERTSDDPGTAEQEGLDLAHVLGGRRRFVVGFSGNPNQSIEIGGGSLTGSVTVGQHYSDTVYGSSEFPLGIDLTADGSTAFKLDVLSGNLIGGIEIESSSGVVSGSTFIEADGSATIPFSNLDAAGLQDVSQITLRFLRSPNFVVSNLRTVPEPTISVLVVVGFFCLLSRHRWP